MRNLLLTVVLCLAMTLVASSSAFAGGQICGETAVISLTRHANFATCDATLEFITPSAQTYVFDVKAPSIGINNILQAMLFDWAACTVCLDYELQPFKATVVSVTCPPVF